MKNNSIKFKFNHYKNGGIQMDAVASKMYGEMCVKIYFSIPLQLNSENNNEKFSEIFITRRYFY